MQGGGSASHRQQQPTPAARAAARRDDTQGAAAVAPDDGAGPSNRSLARKRKRELRAAEGRFSLLEVHDSAVELVLSGALFAIARFDLDSHHILRLAPQTIERGRCRP